jgi:Flp pilus assembly protein TadD
MAERSLALISPSTEWAVPFAQVAKAMAEYRSGNYQQALDWSRKCLSARRNVWFRTAQAHLLCAIAYAQLGRAEQARQSIAEARAVLDKPEPNRDWANWIICQSLLREAEALLKEKDS